MEDMYDSTSGLTHTLRQVEDMTDVPTTQRLRHLENLAHKHPTCGAQVRGTMKRLKHHSSRAKYDMFYDVSPLVRLCAEGTPTAMTGGTLRQKLILSPWHPGEIL